MGVWFLLGCSSAPFEADAGSRRIELGTGTSAFVAIAEGARLELIHGPQGGWHVDTTCRLYGLEPDGLVLSYQAIQPSDGSVVSLPVEVVLRRTRVVPEGDHFLRAGDRTIFDIEGPGEVVGATVELVVRATPTTGEPLEDRRVITVVDAVE